MSQKKFLFKFKNGSSINIISNSKSAGYSPLSFKAVKKSKFKRIHSIKKTVNPLAPCAPKTKDCSISAVFEGPAINVPKPYS